VKITVERCNEFLDAVPQIFDRVKFVALWSAKQKDHQGLRFRSYVKLSFIGGETQNIAEDHRQTLVHNDVSITPGVKTNRIVAFVNFHKNMCLKYM
jgi:hypothetical protein